MAERLWAPWRMTYLEKKESPGNIFVELPSREDDATHFILYRGELAFVMLNAFPYASGHLMVAPYRQIDDMMRMDDAELLEINRLVARCIGWLRAVFQPEGFNIGVNIGRAAGAGIPTHIHWHVVPRWSGDTNFMTTVGDVRVLPQSLNATYEKLKAAISAEG